MLRALRVAVLLALVACDDDGDPLLPPDGPPVVEDPYWQPEPGEVADFDVQLGNSIDVVPARGMYTLDLWDVATETTLDYGGGTTVTVPNGGLAGQIQTQHTMGAIVVCSVEAGAIRLDDPDAEVFPGFAKTVPDRPDAPAAGSVIGWSAAEDPSTRYLDLRAAAREMWRPLLFQRFALAKQLGCDAVAVSWIDQFDPGFDSANQDKVDALGEIAAELHRLELSAGVHVRNMIGYVLTSGLTDSYDFVIAERCAEFDQCDGVRAFEQAGKAVFGVDYTTDGTTDRDGDKIPDGVEFEAACGRTFLPTDWIHKDADATFRPVGGYRMAVAQCPQ